MEAVTTRQSGSTRVSPLVVAVVASATIAGLIAIGSMTGMLPGKRATVRGDEPLPRVESQARPAEQLRFVRHDRVDPDGRGL